MTVQPNELVLEFNPPTEVSDSEFSGILGMNFSDEKPQPKPKEEKEEDENVDEPLKLDPKPLVPKEEQIETDDTFVDIINTLAEEIGFDEAPEGFDPNSAPDKEMFLKFIEHNTAKKIDQAVDELFDNLSEQTKRIVSYDLNSKGENIESYLKSLIEENNIKSLSIDNEFDQEKIVRRYYENTGDFSKEEIEEKLSDLKEASLLEKEAKKLKPKLDQLAEKIAKEQEEVQKQLREYEQQMSKNYNERVIGLLEKGNVGGIKLSKEEVGTIYSFLTDDKMDISLPNGKKTQMAPLDAVIYFNKYDQKGSLENLALATLLLTNPKKFEEVYAKRATTKVTEEFVKNNKYSNALKIGGEPVKEEPKKKQQEDKRYYKWNLKI